MASQTSRGFPHTEYCRGPRSVNASDKDGMARTICNIDGEAIGAAAQRCDAWQVLYGHKP